VVTNCELHTVLIVEVNAISRRMLRVTLEREGYSVLEARDGRGALDTAAANPPDLVLLDIQLPDMDGIEVASRLREMPGRSQLPIVALSGPISRINETRGRAAFTDYLVKPVAPSRLLSTVQVYLSAHEAGRDQSGGGRCIVVADDDPVQLKLLRLHLTERGFRGSWPAAARGAGENPASPAGRRRQQRTDARPRRLPALPGRQGRPGLAHIPVVLISSAFVEDADRDLALQTRATALVSRSPENRDVVDALLAGLAGSPVPTPLQSPALDRDHHLARLVKLLEHQVQLKFSLERRLALREAEFAILSDVTATITKRAPIGDVLGELLHHCLNAAGLSRGAVYLRDTSGELALQAQLGYPEEDATRDFFGKPTVLQELATRGEPATVPQALLPSTEEEALLTAAGVGSIVIGGIGQRGDLGAFWVGSVDERLDTDWVLFAEGMTGRSPRRSPSPAPSPRPRKRRGARIGSGSRSSSRSGSSLTSRTSCVPRSPPFTSS
jgi:CheY-like chemotaxis protein